MPNRATFLTLVLSVSLCWAGGCSDDDNGNGVPVDAGVDVAIEKDSTVIEDMTPDTEPEVTELTTLMNYNVGLIASVVFDRERKPQIIEAVKGLEADVLCMQEVWFDEDAAEFIDAMTETFPYHAREVTKDESEPEVYCKELMKLLSLQKCVQEECTPNGISFEQCAMEDQYCKAELEALTVECQLCLAANLAEGKPQICGLGGGKQYSADGRNGLMIFSKLPIEDYQFTTYESIIVRRGIISATIANTKIMCTHMPTYLAGIPYDPSQERTPFLTWEEENDAAIDLLLSTADGLGEGCKVLMGDLNAGPGDEEAGIMEMYPANFQKILDYGFEEPWENPECTFCSTNPLAGPLFNTRIDHIMFKDCGPDKTYDYSLELKQDITVVDRFGTSHVTKLSDHYVLRVDISKQ